MRESDTELARVLRDRIGRDAVESHGHEDQGDEGQDADEHGVELVLRRRRRAQAAARLVALQTTADAEAYVPTVRGEIRAAFGTLPEKRRPTRVTKVIQAGCLHARERPRSGSAGVPGLALSREHALTRRPQLYKAADDVCRAARTARAVRAASFFRFRPSAAPSMSVIPEGRD